MERRAKAGDLATVPDDVWQVARNRERVVRELVAEPQVHGARCEQMTAAAAALGISTKHLYTLLKAYKADPQTRALLPQRRGPKAGRRCLDPRVEAIIEEEIQSNYLRLLHPKKAALMRGIHARCHAEGLPKPVRETVDARLDRISKREQVKRRYGRKRARDEYDPVRGSLDAARPLEIVQIDHTPADVMAVEAETLEVIGRPFITLAVDICTRVYCGFYITYDPPSAASVAACLAHAVAEKEAWLEARGLPPQWPVCGLCEQIHVDNGKEFHSRAFTRACENYGIEVRYRPPGTPHVGGHVERRIGHLSQELHLLDGSTLSSVQARGVYDSAGNACLTLSEIEWMVASIILEHNSTFHTGINMSPLAKWRTETAGRGQRLPPDMRTFYRDFLPYEERGVQRDGVHLFGIRYWHDGLLPYLHDKKKVVVHYDPADLSKVFVRGLSGDYVEVPYRNLRQPPVSKWELKATRRALRRQGQAGADEAMIFDMVLARRKKLEAARARSRRARLELARAASREAPVDIPPPRSETACAAAISASPSDDDTPVSLPYYDTEDWDDGQL